MPSMREHYNTDGIRISTTERYYFFLHHLPHYSTSFGCFFCAFMGENWMTKMDENWEVGDIYSTHFLNLISVCTAQYTECGLISITCFEAIKIVNIQMALFTELR